MFCGCAVAFGADPNTLCCPVCLGLPGALPVLNKRAIEMTLLAGRMLGCSTPEISKWDRKNYFYPDMPKNYQISQFDLPLCLGGGVPLYELSYPKDHQKSILNPGKIIGLTRIHLEEDVAKSTHLPKSTLIDFNRAGTPLMEIVSEPEIESPEEAVAYLNSLRQILLYGEVSDADMEKGQMRCDVNVSVRPKNQEQFGTKIELKNLNSVSAVRRALHYEIDRQVQELEEGNRIVQATWRWNDDAGQTEWMRNKEDSHDYRYFPDPDLLPVRTATMLAAIEAPELPHQKQDRFIRRFRRHFLRRRRPLCGSSASQLLRRGRFGHSVRKKIANWVINNLLSALKDADLNLLESPIRPLQIRALVQLIEDGRLTNNQAKEVFARVFSEPHHEDIAALAISMGFEPASAGEVETFVDQVIAANPGLIAEIKGGNAKAINSLLGQVMKLSGGKGDPKVIRQLLEQKTG